LALYKFIYLLTYLYDKDSVKLESG